LKRSSVLMCAFSLSSLGMLSSGDALAGVMDGEQVCIAVESPHANQVARFLGLDEEQQRRWECRKRSACSCFYVESTGMTLDAWEVLQDGEWVEGGWLFDGRWVFLAREQGQLAEAPEPGPDPFPKPAFWQTVDMEQSFVDEAPEPGPDPFPMPRNQWESIRGWELNTSTHVVTHADEEKQIVAVVHDTGETAAIVVAVDSIGEDPEPGGDPPGPN
jgi:hypothetical protein